MKKLLLVVLLVIAFLFCGFETLAEENAAVKYIDGIRNAYQLIANVHNYRYRVGNSLESTYHERNVISADTVIDAYTSYSFDILFEGADELALYTYFAMDSVDTDDKSFSINCWNDKVSAKMIKELVAATLYVVEENMDNEKAQATLKQLVNTYDGKTHSSVYSNDDYYVFISYDETYGGNSLTNINVIDKQRLLLTDEEKSNYVNMTYSEICAPLNALELVCFEGIPVKRIEAKSSSWLDTNKEYWDIKLEDGNVCVEYSFDIYPFSIDLEVPYVFYGCILGKRNYIYH